MDGAWNDQDQHFWLRLAETIAWCSAQPWSFHLHPIRRSVAHPANDYERYRDVLDQMNISSDLLSISGSGLRTPHLCPPPIDDNAGAGPRAEYAVEKRRKPLAQEVASAEHQWQQCVAQLAAQRAVLVHDQKLPIHELNLPLAQESLLAYLPCENLSDGAAAVASDGYFDSENVPPWDTWVVYIAHDHLLLSWVPDSLVDVVGEGIDANPENCIGWATDVDTPYIKHLRQAGLVR